MKLPGKYALTKELWLVVAIKLLLLYAIWRLFFAHPIADKLNDGSVAAHIFSQTTQSPAEK